MPQLTVAEEYLTRADAKLAVVIEQVIARSGPCEMSRQPDAWRALACSIIGQQVSTHAARAITGRFAALQDERDFPAPAFVLAAPEEVLRGAGLSANKARALRDLASYCEAGKIETAKLAEMDDEAVIEALLPVRGIGRWTAEMFLLGCLGRLDVLAVDDLGLRRAMKLLHDLPALPVAAEMRALAEPWRPYRSVAARYLWRWLDTRD